MIRRSPPNPSRYNFHRSSYPKLWTTTDLRASTSKSQVLHARQFSLFVVLTPEKIAHPGYSVVLLAPLKGCLTDVSMDRCRCCLLDAKWRKPPLGVGIGLKGTRFAQVCPAGVPLGGMRFAWQYEARDNAPLLFFGIPFFRVAVSHLNDFVNYSQGPTKT